MKGGDTRGGEKVLEERGMRQKQRTAVAASLCRRLVEHKDR